MTVESMTDLDIKLINVLYIKKKSCTIKEIREFYNWEGREGPTDNGIVGELRKLSNPDRKWRLVEYVGRKKRQGKRGRPQDRWRLSHEGYRKLHLTEKLWQLMALSSHEDQSTVGRYIPPPSKDEEGRWVSAREDAHLLIWEILDDVANLWGIDKDALRKLGFYKIDPFPMK